MYDKEKLFRYRRASKVNLYEMDGFRDYFYGYMVPDTSYLTVWKLFLYDKDIGTISIIICSIPTPRDYFSFGIT
jgi:uridine kinase